MALLKKPVPARKLTLGSGKTLAKKPGLAASGFDAPKKGTVSSGGAFAQARAERKKQELNRNRPFGVKVPVGGSLTVYILDKGEPWRRYEHQVGASKTSAGTTYPCIMDGDEMCPICAKENKQGTFVMYLTAVVPIERYEKQDGEKVVRYFSKKLFVIKTKMSGKYERIYEQHGSFRGLVLKLTRDGKLDPSTGNDVEVVRKMSEAEIAKMAKQPEIKMGTELKKFRGEELENILKAKIDVPIEYEKVMPRPSAKELGAMVGQKVGDKVGGSDFDDDEPGDFGSAGDWGAGS